MAALGKDLLRKRGSSCESLPLYAVNEVPAKEEEKEEAPNEAVRSVSNESSKRCFYLWFIPAVAIFTLVALLSMQLLHMEQEKFQRLDKTISELKAQVRAAQNELALVRKSKAWEESDAMTQMLNRLARAERNTQQFKKDTEQHKKDLEQCKREVEHQREEEQSSKDVKQCRTELGQLRGEFEQSQKDLQQSVSEGVQCKQDLEKLKSTSLKLQKQDGA
uniref:Uncharacterized protein n=1 Tax=Dunaliella tertiolecta TaxID=3047 RepID=A0A7S3VSC8_DUNTE|mmetsp:Transcript_20354/g.56710  ORF Transcript_20354/g.56710 Transcript_20354/m.56710 type:complete len:219 (-) Transcript_20354:185-841(-)